MNEAEEIINCEYNDDKYDSDLEKYDPNSNSGNTGLMWRICKRLFAESGHWR